MKQSLWISSSSSLIIFLCAIVFIFFTGVNKTKFLPLKASLVKEAERKKLTSEDVIKIFENDLFDTYIPKPPIKKIEVANFEKPKMPEVIEPPILAKKEPNFLEPIPYTLVGTVVSQVDTESIAVVNDNRTKKEKSYYLGDEIEDSQIIDINYKSITLIRSNGQKETLYLPGFDKILRRFNEVDAIIAKNTDTHAFIIDPEAFVNKIRSLGNLINDLNLLTAYENGLSIGCKIGYFSENSIAPIIGFEKSDIILNINGLPLANLDQRLEAYNSIINLKHGDEIIINLIRDNQEITLKYILGKISDLDSPKNFKNIDSVNSTTKMIRDDLERRYKFAPTVAEIKESEEKL